MHSQVSWFDSCRLVASRFPPVSLYDRVADPADLEVVYAIEALTNPRIRQENGDLSLVPISERICGPGTTPIMAAFTYLNAAGSRFSDGTYGVYYAANDLETAVAEVSHHRAKFLGSTNEPPMEIDMRCYRVTVEASLYELRAEQSVAVYVDPGSYVASQQFALQRRAAGDHGIVYDSVRRPGGGCVALFTPKATCPPARQGEHISLVWDGKEIKSWYMKSEIRSL